MNYNVFVPAAKIKFSAPCAWQCTNPIDNGSSFESNKKSKLWQLIFWPIPPNPIPPKLHGKWDPDVYLNWTMLWSLPS